MSRAALAMAALAASMIAPGGYTPTYYGGRVLPTAYRKPGWSLQGPTVKRRRRKSQILLADLIEKGKAVAK